MERDEDGEIWAMLLELVRFFGLVPCALGGSHEVGLHPCLGGLCGHQSFKTLVAFPQQQCHMVVCFVSHEKMAGPRRKAEDDARLKGAQNF